MTLDGDWDFPLLEELIQTRGDRVIWEKAIASPNRNEDPYASQLLIEQRRGDRPLPDDSHDGGTGWRYRDAQYVTGLITGIDSGRNKQLMDAGIAVPGDAVFSPSFDVKLISDYDKITMTVPAPVDDGQVIVRNAANMDSNAALNHDILVTEDRLWYIPAQPIWCEDTYGNVYTYGSDYSLDVARKRIVWNGLKKPLDGVSYTFKYLAYLEWICFASPFIRFDNGRTLAPRVLLRKQHVEHLRNKLDSPTKRAEEEVSFTTRGRL